MTALLKFPIKHIDENIVFSYEGEVMAYFEVLGFGYDFLDNDDKFSPFSRQLSYLESQGHDVHYLIVPQTTNVDDVIEEHQERMKYKSEQYDYELLDAGTQYMDAVKSYLQNKRKSKEKREYKMYFGIQLNKDKNVYKKGNKGTNAIQSMIEFFKGFNSEVNRAIGLEAFDILESELEAYKRQAQKISDDVRRAFTSTDQVADPVRKISTSDLIYLIESLYSATISNKEVMTREDFESGQDITVKIDDDEVKAVRPTPRSFFEPQETYIEEVAPDTLKLTKKVDGERQHIYTRFHVITRFNDTNDFPGSEWLYHIQRNLDFPCVVSIRSHHKDNERVLKELSDKRLEYNDQNDEAKKAGVSVDMSVQRNEKGVMLLEDYFQRSGYPSYVSSFVIRVNAESIETLDNRTGDLEDLLRRYGIKVLSPFGEQPFLYMETLPGSKAMNDDYKCETDPRMLAGMMFGATTSIGDNMGFAIGETEQKKDVFIYPELASKSLEGVETAFNSISALVAGATGFGKSVLMNLITMLSVLSGAYALVIDPKGDRKGWKKGLPYIPKKYIRIWELGTDSRDKGSLDPFRTSPDIAQGRKVAENIFAYLIDAKIGEIKYSFIAEAMRHAQEQPEPCVGIAIDYLKEMHKNPPKDINNQRFNDLDELVRVLDTFLQEEFISLLIGHPGEDYTTLEIDKPLQVLMIENLELPNAEKSPKEYTTEEKISTGIMISITSFAQQFMFNNDRTRHKVILQDEASVIDKNDHGRKLMDFIVRQGRYYTTTLLKGSQNASDHSNDLANLGMKFCFALKTTEEAEKMLEYYSLPVTTSNVEKLKNLPKGYCLFQDVFGRTDVMRVNVMFKQVLEAFDTSTSDTEEKEFEKELRSRRESREKVVAVFNDEQHASEENDASEETKKTPSIMDVARR